jgi:toxin ParE1/3/4
VKKIFFHPEVFEEVNSAYMWYEEKASGLGEEFLKELEASFLIIQNRPLMWRTYFKKYRRFLLKRFPYGIIY